MPRPNDTSLASRLLSPIERFLSIEAASGILLVAATVVALAWANSPWRSTYEAIQHAVHFWINDGLMVVFFFVVGLEIKRELHGGELSDAKRAALPAIAALGGMLVPAGIYLALNAGTPTARGWGVPMATDIAFAVGVLALLGKRVPPPLRILLLALAVIDDLGAIVVIAAFYSSGIAASGLAIAVLGIGLILLMQKLGVRSPWSYVPAAIVTWAGTYAAGVHPAIAGVAVGLLTPTRARPGEDVAPVERVERALHGWVAYLIMPVFALANAGVALDGVRLGGEGTAVFLGVALGLVVGKPIGVLVFSWLAVRARLASLPTGVRWSGVAVVGLVAGIGFTMALFIATLAFPADAALGLAKLGILTASLVAGAVGLVAAWFLLARGGPS